MASSEKINELLQRKQELLKKDPNINQRELAHEFSEVMEKFQQEKLKNIAPEKIKIASERWSKRLGYRVVYPNI